MSQSLLDRLFDRSRATLAALALVLVAGAVALHEIPKEAEPDIEVPVLRVSVTHSGISPQDADRLLAGPMLRELRTLEGLEHIRSSSYPGGTALLLEFEEDFDFDARAAMDEVRSRFDQLRDDLPDDAGEPRVSEVNLGLTPLLVVTIAGPLPERDLVDRAKHLQDELLRLESVLDVTLSGEREENLEIVVDPLVLASHGLDIDSLLSTIDRSNRIVPTGGVDSGSGRLELTLRGLFVSVEDVMDLPVKATSDSVVRLSDVATIKPALSDRATVARINGEPAVALTVTKRIGANVFETLEDVRSRVDDHTRGWPSALRVEFSQDSSWRIRTRIAELSNSLASAVLLVMVLVVAALGLRSGALVGLAIPGSILIALLILGLGGFSINTAVLYAFVMAVGLLVDGAIVTVESADRYIAEGMPPREAYQKSVRVMRAPILSSTATTLAAFLPLLFWPGVIGEYLKFLPLTLLLALTGSVLMALVFVPVLGAALAGRRRASPEPSAERRESWLVRGYESTLRQVLVHPAWVVAGAIALLIWSMWLYERYGHRNEFLPEIEPTSALVLIRAQGDLSLKEKQALVLEAERIVRRFQAFETVFTRIGRATASQPGSGMGDVIGTLLAEFKPWHEHAPAEQVLQQLEDEFGQLGGVTIEVQRLRAGPARGKPIDIDVTAPSVAALETAVRKVRRFTEAHPSLRGVEDSRPATGIEWQLQIDRAEAARFGVDVALISQYARFVTRGLKLGTLDLNKAPDGIGGGRSVMHYEEADIRMRFPARYRDIDGLRTIQIQTSAGAVPLSHFARLEPAPRAGTVERLNGVLSRSVKAEIIDDAVDSDVIRDVKAWVNGASFEAGASAKMRGEDEDRQEAREFLLMAFGAALVLMALILVAQFNSFFSAFLVLFAVVLATVGVRLGLLVIDMPFGIVMSGIGLIALAGIVVNNNIILIDGYNRFRREGLNADEALLRTGRTRLRPVLLTSITTIAGLMPLVLQVDIDLVGRALAIGAPGALYWVQMSSAVVFGLAFATVLTLFVTPAALKLRDNVTEARAREAANPDAESIRGVFERHGAVVGVSALTAIFAAWFFIPEMIGIRILDIFSKQIFEQPPSRWFQALESASFWSLIILAAAYAYWRNDHVRIDLIRDRLSNRGRAVVEIVGFIFLLAPVCLVITIAGWEFVVTSFADEEASGALLGSPTLWIFKLMMVLCFAQLLAIGVVVSWRNLRFLRGREAHIFPPPRHLHGAGADE